MERSEWRQIDYLMFLIVLCLLAYGMAMVYSATLQLGAGGGISEMVARQGIYAAIGVCLLLAALYVDYRLLGNAYLVFYVLALVGLVLVLVVGQVTHGSQRWINLGFFPLQPSEPAKLLVVMTLARYLSDREEDMHKFRYVLFSLAIVALPTALVFIQPDLATSLTLPVIWASMLLVAGARWWHWIILIGSAVVAAPAAWNFLQPYQQERILLFMGLMKDTADKGLGSEQALIAIGSGGVLGQGFTTGSQSQLHFVQVQYADFIFTVLAEEWGFVGALALFVLFLGLVFRAVRVASVSRDGFGRLIATGIAVMFTFQVFVNVGMNIGVLPVAGIPLPFISYGGSSLVPGLVAIGLLQNVVMRHKRPTI